MQAFTIKTNKSDYPFLVIADGFKSAVEVLYQKGIYDTDIISVQQMEAVKSDHILIEERLTSKEVLREEVRRELQKDMPRWMPEPNGAAGGTDRDLYLIRTSKGNYFTSKCIGGTNYYLVLDTLEQLPGLPKQDKFTPQGIVLTINIQTTMQNFDELAEGYLGLVEKQKVSEGKAVDSFTRGDMETCFVSGAQSMEQLQEGCEGTFGQAVGSLKHGFLVRRKGWNGKGMFLFLRPWDSLKDEFIIDTVKSLPWSFKAWVKAHPNAEGERLFTQYICMKAADGSIVNGWLASQTDMLSEDWVLVDPNE